MNVKKQNIALLCGLEIMFFAAEKFLYIIHFELMSI